VTQLRQKMLEELQRRNYSHRTAKTYVRIVREFATIPCACPWLRWPRRSASLAQIRTSPYPLSNTVSRCSSVAASKPRFTSILRPLVTPTTNPLLMLAEFPLAVLISTANNRLLALLP
jgi:hypothetical protein